MVGHEVTRQHYVPRTYLKHFSIEKNESYFISGLALPKLDPESIREFNIANICLQKDIYTLPGVTPEQRMLLEKFYSDRIEAHYNSIYGILIDPTKRTITTRERELIISTVVTMFYRTTRWVNLHNEVVNNLLADLYRMCKSMGKDYFISDGEKISIKGKTLEQIQKETKLESRPSQVVAQLKIALRLINLRIERDGIMVVKLGEESDEFITSDHPVSYSSTNNSNAPFDPMNLLKLPIDKKHILYLMPYADSNTKNNIVRVTHTGPLSFNEKMVSNHLQFQIAERFILGSKTGLINYLNIKDQAERPLSTEELEKLKQLNDFLNHLKKKWSYALTNN